MLFEKSQILFASLITVSVGGDQNLEVPDVGVEVELGGQRVLTHLAELYAQFLAPTRHNYHIIHI